MATTTALQAVVLVGFATAMVASTVYLHRHLPAVYPREETRLDPRTYRAVRAAIAVGIPLGAAGATVSLLDTVGGVQAARGTTGLLPALSVLLPGWLATWTVRLGVGLLVGAALLAGAVEYREARE